MHEKEKKSNGRETKSQASGAEGGTADIQNLVWGSWTQVCLGDEARTLPCLTWGGRGTGKVAVAKPVQVSAKPYHISQAGVMSKKILRLWPLGGERLWHLHSETLRPGVAALIRVQLCLPSLQPVCVLVPDLCCALETPLISHLGCA